jgi:hypothetical protein
MTPKGVVALGRWSNASPPHHYPIFQQVLSVDISFKDDIIVILLYGVVSYMYLGKSRATKPTALQDVTDNSLHTVLKRR